MTMQIKTPNQSEAVDKWIGAIFTAALLKKDRAALEQAYSDAIDRLNGVCYCFEKCECEGVGSA